jgi:hypothetical protein
MNEHPIGDAVVVHPPCMTTAGVWFPWTGPVASRACGLIEPSTEWSA